MNKLHGTRHIASLSLAAMAGAAVMVVELGVARILTPVFGGSISVWAIVIATTMLALAAGYAFGGYRADRTGGCLVANRAALIGAFLCVTIPVLRRPIISATIDMGTLTGATVSAGLLIAPALFFLSQVSPALIRGLANNGVRELGSTAGGIYAISTIGSLVGTLAAVWLFLYTPLALGFAVTALLLVVPVLFIRLVPAIAAMMIIALTGWYGETGMRSAYENTVGVNAYKQSCRLLAKRSTLYGELRIIEQDDRYRYLIVNGTDQGGIDLRSGESAYTFDQGMLGLASLYTSEMARALVIGLGPGGIPKVLDQGGVVVDVVEIDAAVVQAAREYFNYVGNVTVADGRRFLQRSQQHWDVIFVDAFLGGSPPWQLYTREAFSLYERHLSPGGVVVINLIGSHLDKLQRPALEAVVSTARAVFSTVDAYPDPWESDDSPTRNILIAATNHNRLLPKQAGDPVTAETLADAIARSLPVTISNGRILLDDSAPLEPMVRRTTEILRSRTRGYLPVNVLFY